MRALGFFSFILFLSFLCSCGSKKQTHPDNCPDTTSESTLTSLPFEYNDIGLKSVKVIDSLLIVSHNDHWRIMTVDGKDKGELLSKGQGPGEFLYMPYSGSSAYITINDTLYAYVYDSMKHEVMRVNLSRFLAEGKAVGEFVNHPDCLNEYAWEVIPYSPDGFLISKANESLTGFNRIIFDGENIIEPASTTEWSKEKVENETKLLLLAKNTRYNSEVDKFVEVMMYLGRINIYSRDGSFGKSITLDNSPASVSEIASVSHLDRINNFISVSAWKQGFGGVYSGLTEKDWINSVASNSEILFFDWNGDPVCKVVMPVTVLGFDMDFNNKVLYAIDQTNDLLLAFDATPIVAAFSNHS